MDGMDPRCFDDAARAAADAAPREKRPLHREAPPPAPFPLRALGPLREAVEAVQARTQCPPALCAQSVLSSATLAAQAHADVELPTGKAHPLSELFVTVAGSGERKTTADRIALAECYRVEEEWRVAHAEALDLHRRDHAAWKEAVENIKREAKKAKAQDGGRAAIRDALARAGAEPKPPPHPMMLVADPTPDGLVVHLQHGRAAAGVWTAGGGGGGGGGAGLAENRMRTAALLNAVWDGEPIRQARVLRGQVFLAGRRVAMHLMMQPAVASRLLGDPLLDGMGLLARCLTVEPGTAIGTRMWREAPPSAAATLDAHRARLGRLLRAPPATSAEDEGALTPRAVPLSAEAARLWIAFHDKVEADLAEGGALRPIRGFGAKMAEHAGRLAGVLTIYADPGAAEVGGEAMRCGTALAQHYGGEALRLHGAAAVPAGVAMAARLLRWWQGRGDPVCDLATIYQRGPHGLGTAEKTRETVAMLADHGQVRRLPRGTPYDGKPRQEVWELVG